MVNYTVRPPAARSKGKQENTFKRMLVSVLPWKGDDAAEMIRKTVFLGAVITFAVTGGTLIKDVSGEMIQKYVVDTQIQDIKDRASGGSLNLEEEIIEEIKSEKPYIREEMMSLYDINNDLLGWINVGGEDKIIDLPVVQTDNNDKYLNTDFYGNSSKSGTIFADYRCAFTRGMPSDFTILYGHNTYASTAFSKLGRYYYDKDNPDPNADKSISFYQKHPTITFDTLAQEGTYKIFAVCLFNTDEQYGEVYNYLRYGEPFKDKDDFNNYILDIMDRSCLLTDVDLTYGDEILCMSTCAFPISTDLRNSRYGIFARKVREGESAEVDVSKASRTYYWKGWEQLDNAGISSVYAKRTWDTSKLLSYQEN
ncbi:MAG: class B sortase [Ruminococcaceae bacterium]|nr:class B sortase [Oscillospiraceae bacterium]